MLDDLRYEIKSWITWATGKGSIGAIKNGGLALAGWAWNRPIEHIAGLNVWTALGGAGALLSTAVSASLAQMEYNENHRRLITQYNPEIAAALGKHVGSIGRSELYDLAEGKNGHAGNRVLEEELKRINSTRWLKMGVSLATSVAVFAGIATLTMASSVAIPALGMMAIGVVGGVVIGQTLGYVGEKALGLDQPSPHSQVAQIAKSLGGKGRVSPEQVMNVFISAEPHLNQSITKEYGAPYSYLTVKQQQEVIQKYAPGTNIERLTEDLNNRQIRASELSFIVSGQPSGVPRLSEPPAGYVTRAQMAAEQAYHKGRENFNYAWEQSRTHLTPIVEQGREKFAAGFGHAQEKLGQGYHKLVETGGKYLGSFRNASVEGTTLSAEKSAETLQSLESVKGKWQRMLAQQAENSTGLQSARSW